MKIFLKICIGFFVLIGIFLIFTFVKYPSLLGFTKAIIYSPKCNKYDTKLEIPDIMKNSIIRFETPYSARSYSDEKYPKDCDGVLSKSDGLIVTAINYSYKLSDSYFKVLEHVYVNCKSPFDLNCFEGSPGDMYLLEEISTGKKYTIGYIYLDMSKVGSDKQVSAGYYNPTTTQRIADVDINSWSCSSNGCSESFW